jgi:hypothetical protein
MQAVPLSGWAVIRVRRESAAVIAFFAALQCVAGGASLTISPPSIGSDFIGTVKLEVAGINSGAAIRIEKFLDENSDGQIQASEPLLQSFLVVDGQVPVIGGITNLLVFSDADGTTNGAVTVQLDFSQTTELDRISGQYLFRLSEPNSSFAPVIQPFAITAVPLSQGVRGQVTDATSGKPIPSAQVALVNLDTSTLVGSVFDDANGQFTVYTQPGKYLLLPLRRGYVFTVDVSQLEFATLEVKPLEFLTNNVSLRPGTTPISGVVKDAGTGAGIPGVAVYALSTGQQGDLISSLSFTFGLTDQTGNFSVMAADGTWGFVSLPQELARIGYLALSDLATVTVTNRIATNVTVALPKSTSLIYGQVKSQSGKPLAGVQVQAEDSDLGFQTFFITDASGNYMLGVAAGHWSIAPSYTSTDNLGYESSDPVVLVMNDGDALQQNFSLQPVPLSLFPTGLLHQDGSFTFDVIGEAGNAYGIERSTDLKNWAQVAQITISVNPYHFVDKPPTPGGNAFYRARLASGTQ